MPNEYRLAPLISDIDAMGGPIRLKATRETCRLPITTHTTRRLYKVCEDPADANAIAESLARDLVNRSLRLRVIHTPMEAPTVRIFVHRDLASPPVATGAGNDTLTAHVTAWHNTAITLAWGGKEPIAHANR